MPIGKPRSFNIEDVEQRVSDLEREIQQLRSGVLGWKTTAKCRIYLSSAQDNIAENEWVKVLLDGITYDPSNLFNSTLRRIIIEVPGYYDVDAQVGIKSGVVADKRLIIAVYVNGVVVFRGDRHASFVSYHASYIGDKIHLDKDDYVELYVYSQDTSNLADLHNLSKHTYMSLHLLSRD